ncbi:nuclear transport factor 2 family protein [Streptomyces sp. NPDC049687]|uniref:nuclear transport factor 2 family protein n=1 Tax=Streptomyces sp. NPDC049687 TaxID=3365596 RepID=UPI0037AB58E2
MHGSRSRALPAIPAARELELYDTGSVDGADEVFAPDVIGHNPAGDAASGIDGMRASIAAVRDGITDTQHRSRCWRGGCGWRRVRRRLPVPGAKRRRTHPWTRRIGAFDAPVRRWPCPGSVWHSPSQWGLGGSSSCRTHVHTLCGRPGAVRRGSDQDHAFPDGALTAVLR